MRKKPEYRVIWVTPPDPVKFATALCQAWAKQNGLEFIGLEKTEAKK